MKHFLFIALSALSLAVVSCVSFPKPTLGKVADGYLVNVDNRGVILQGHDPVSLRQGKNEVGNATINALYHGAVYHFATEENKQEFLANPKQYEPEFGGYCAYGLAVGNLAPIELWTYDTTFQHLNLYQHNQKAVNGWKQDVSGNYVKALGIWGDFQKKYIRKNG